MNKEAKKVFIEQWLMGFRAAILEQVDRMPEEWDGVDLRMYIASKALDMCSCRWMDGYKKRQKSVENEIIVRNL